MKLKNVLITFAIMVSSIGSGDNSAKAQTLTITEAQQLLNRYCTKEVQIAYGIASLISGGSEKVKNSGLSPQQCSELSLLYHQLLNQRQRPRQSDYQREYYRRYGRDGSYMRHNLESIEDSNCLASSSGC